MHPECQRVNRPGQGTIHILDEILAIKGERILPTLMYDYVIASLIMILFVDGRSAHTPQNCAGILTLPP